MTQLWFFWGVPQQLEDEVDKMRISKPQVRFLVVFLLSTAAVLLSWNWWVVLTLIPVSNETRRWLIKNYPNYIVKDAEKLSWMALNDQSPEVPYDIYVQRLTRHAQCQDIKVFHRINNSVTSEDSNCQFELLCALDKVNLEEVSDFKLFFDLLPVDLYMSNYRSEYSAIRRFLERHPEMISEIVEVATLNRLDEKSEEDGLEYLVAVCEVLLTSIEDPAVIRRIRQDLKPKFDAGKIDDRHWIVTKFLYINYGVRLKRLKSGR